MSLCRSIIMHAASRTDIRVSKMNTMEAKTSSHAQ